MLTQAPKGTNDVLPDRAHIWQYLEDEIRKICKEYNLPTSKDGVNKYRKENGTYIPSKNSLMRLKFLEQKAFLSKHFIQKKMNSTITAVWKMMMIAIVVVTVIATAIVIVKMIANVVAKTKNAIALKIKNLVVVKILNQLCTNWVTTD